MFLPAPSILQLNLLLSPTFGGDQPQADLIFSAPAGRAQRLPTVHQLDAKYYCQLIRHRHSYLQLQSQLRSHPSDNNNDRYQHYVSSHCLHQHTYRGRLPIFYPSLGGFAVVARFRHSSAPVTRSIDDNHSIAHWQTCRTYLSQKLQSLPSPSLAQLSPHLKLKRIFPTLSLAAAKEVTSQI